MDRQIHYKKLVTWTNTLRSRYLRTLAASRLFDRSNELVTTTKIGKKNAHSNARIMDEHKYFFLTVKEATRVYVLIELSKFFDTSDDALTIQKVIEYARNNLASLTKEEFIEFHKNDSSRTQFLEEYESMQLRDLMKMLRRLKSNENKIQKLKTYRDQFLAHDDLKKKKISFKKRDVDVLLNIVKDVIELFYKRLTFSSNSYHIFIEEPVKDIDWIIKKLKWAKTQQASISNLRHL